MGILEAIVVVYLRRIYYPGGFGFPLVVMDAAILRAELIREAMTLVMLGCLAWIAAERAWARLLAFLVAFGVWDIAYYVGLKLFLGWPAHFLEPDILFLLPVVWIGPVLAPLLVAGTWTAGGLLLHRHRYANLGWGWREWVGLAAAHGLMLSSFLIHAGTQEEPGFRWPLFLAGYGLGLAVLLITLVRVRRPRRAHDTA